eukprot:scaffold200646_cov21-Tisochrysis_lutea.AAC.1
MLSAPYTGVSHGALQACAHTSEGEHEGSIGTACNALNNGSTAGNTARSTLVHGQEQVVPRGVSPGHLGGVYCPQASLGPLGPAIPRLYCAVLF